MTSHGVRHEHGKHTGDRKPGMSQKSPTRSYVPSSPEAMAGWQAGLGYRGVTGTSHAPFRGPALLGRRHQQSHAHSHAKLSATFASPGLTTSSDARQGALHVAARGRPNKVASPEAGKRTLPVKSLVLDRSSEKPEVTVERPPRPKSAGQARYVDVDEDEDDSEMDGEIEVIDLDTFTDSALFSPEVLPARSSLPLDSQPEVQDPDVESRHAIAARPKSRAGRRQHAPTEEATGGLSRTGAEGSSGRHGDGVGDPARDRRGRRHSDDVPSSTGFGEEAARNPRRRIESCDSYEERPPTRVGFYDETVRKNSGGDKPDEKRVRKKRESESKDNKRSGHADAKAPSSPVKTLSPERRIANDEEAIFQAIPKKSVIDFLRESGIEDVDGMDFEFILVKKARSSVEASKGNTATGDSIDVVLGSTARAEVSQKLQSPEDSVERKTHNVEGILKTSVKTSKGTHNKATTPGHAEVMVLTSTGRDQSKHKSEKVKNRKKKDGKTRTKNRSKEGEKTRPALRPLKRSPDHKELMERSGNQRPSDTVGRSTDAKEQRYVGSIQARADNILFGNRLGETLPQSSQLSQSMNNADLFRKPILGEHFLEQQLAEGAVFAKKGASSLKTSGFKDRDEDENNADDNDCRTYTVIDKYPHHNKRKQKHVHATKAEERKTDENSKTTTKFGNSPEETEVRGFLCQGKLFFGETQDDEDTDHRTSSHHNKNVQAQQKADEHRHKNVDDNSGHHGSQLLTAESEALLHKHDNLRPSRSSDVDKPNLSRTQAFEALPDKTTSHLKSQMIKKEEVQVLIEHAKTGADGEDKNDQDDQSDSLKNPVKAATADRTLDEAISPWEEDGEEDSGACTVLRKSQLLPPSREDTFASTDSSLRSWDEDEVPLVLNLPPDDDDVLTPEKKHQYDSLFTSRSLVPPLPTSGLAFSRWTVDSDEEDMAYKTPRATRTDPHPPFSTVGSLPVVLENQTARSSEKASSRVDGNSLFQKNPESLQVSSPSSSDTLKARSAHSKMSSRDQSSPEQTDVVAIDGSCAAVGGTNDVDTARFHSGDGLAENPAKDKPTRNSRTRRRSEEALEATAAARFSESSTLDSKNFPERTKGRDSGSAEIAVAVESSVSSRPTRLAPLSPRSPASQNKNLFIFGAPPTSVSGSEPPWTSPDETNFPFSTELPMESPRSLQDVAERKRQSSMTRVTDGGRTSTEISTRGSSTGTDTCKSSADFRRNFRRVSAGDGIQDTPRGRVSKGDDQVPEELDGTPRNVQSEGRRRKELRLSIPQPGHDIVTTSDGVQEVCSADVTNDDGPSWATEIGPVRLSSSLDSKAVPTASQRKLKVISPRQSTETLPSRWSVSKSSAEFRLALEKENADKPIAGTKEATGRNRDTVTRSPGEEEDCEKRESQRISTSWSSLASERSSLFPEPPDKASSQESKDSSIDNKKTTEEALLDFMRKSQATASSRPEEETKSKSKVALTRQDSASDNSSLSLSAKTSTEGKEVRVFSYPPENTPKHLNSPPDMISTFSGSSERGTRRRHISDDSGPLSVNPPPQLISTFSSSSSTGNDVRLSASFGGTRTSSSFVPPPPEMISTFASSEPELADRRSSGTVPSSLRLRDGTSQSQNALPLSASSSSETRSAFPFSPRDVSASSTWLSSSLDSRTWTPRASGEGHFNIQPSPREGRLRFTPSPPSSKPPSPDIKSHFAPAPPSRPSPKGLAASAENDLDLSSSLTSRRRRQLKPAGSLESRDEGRGVKASFPRKLKPLVSPDKLEAFVMAGVEGEAGRGVATIQSAGSSQDFSKES